MTANQYRAALSRLGYDPETGLFWWTVATRNAVAGKRAGCITRSGSVAIQIDGKQILAHRLAWFFIHGEIPEAMIDHINRDPADNRAANLRKATASENQWNRGLPKNNKSGSKGVSWRARRQKWYAAIAISGKSKYLGSFDTVEAASAAYEAARLKYHGEYGQTL